MNGENVCDMRNSALEAISSESWNFGEDAPIKGYELKILVGEDENTEELFLLKEGNVTKNYRGASQSFNKRGEDYEILFKAYYS